MKEKFFHNMYNKQMKTTQLHNQKSYRNTFSQNWLALPVILIEDSRSGLFDDDI